MSEMKIKESASWFTTKLVIFLLLTFLILSLSKFYGSSLVGWSAIIPFLLFLFLIFQGRKTYFEFREKDFVVYNTLSTNKEVGRVEYKALKAVTISDRVIPSLDGFGSARFLFAEVRCLSKLDGDVLSYSEQIKKRSGIKEVGLVFTYPKIRCQSQLPDDLHNILHPR